VLVLGVVHAATNSVRERRSTCNVARKEEAPLVMVQAVP